MTQFAIAVGSNLGDRVATITTAATMLSQHLSKLIWSNYHKTAPVGGPPGQSDYLNAVWIVDTDLGAHQLLHSLQRIESALGRTREIANGPRTIDLDLLLTNPPGIIRSGVLTLPHPRLHERAFVLDPLAEVAGDWRHPLLNASISELKHRLSAKPGLAG